MKTSKKVISLVLAVIMVMTSFAIGLPFMKIDAKAATTIDGVTQERIVGTDGSYKTTYDNYAAAYLNGASSPTNIVIPGLNANQDYVIQGMTYYPDRDWMLITAYHNAADGETVQSSKVFAIDAATGNFVAMFSFLNPDGTLNTEHGGGIACSENNIYYACGDDDRDIAYAPISAFATAPTGQHTVVQLKEVVTFNEIGSVTSSSKTAYTAYVCYDQGILWTGNFYDMGVKILGISVAATDYSVPAHDEYKSMVFGYELKGNSSEEEWSNLMGATGKDCRGNPSYTIGLNNAIKDVQYAVVDNGKLYLSCSFGTGEGTNSVSLGGMDPYSTLIVADIDLSQPGTKSISLNTHNGAKNVMAYDIQDYKSYKMMPMSEGLCVINNQIFITFESASNKYLNEAGTLTGNCKYPIDVVWQLDPYELMEITTAEPEKSIYYEKIYSLADIKDGEEYIIVHESRAKDPVTQKNYLYAFNSDGNFKGHKLSKSDTDVVKGYDGMIGHPISHYSYEKGVYDEDILYLENPEVDDVENIRWTLTKRTDGTNKYSIKTTETYFANNDSLYFDGSKISMMPSNSSYLANVNIGQLEDSSGYFYFSNGDAYLWCNDGVNETYNAKANARYAANASNPIFDGTTEVPGTIHCDALNITGSNILGGQIDTSNDKVLYQDGAFQIYRRVVDEVSSTYESRVYTDLQAKLQEDGTYEVVLETFAISPNHYQYRGEKPTDYIIVADTSSSMDSTGSTGIAEYSGALAVSSLSTEANTSDDNGVGINGYGFSNPDEDIYIKHSDGRYYKVYLAVNTAEKGFLKIRQQYWAYYIADDGLYYVLNGEGNSTVDAGITSTQFKYNVDNSIEYSDYSTKTSNSTRRKQAIYTGPHYRFDDINSAYKGEHTRINTLKTAASNLVGEIAAQNAQNRIALIKYGADASSGFVAPSGFTTTASSNVFWATGAADQLKAKVNEITTSAQTNNSGIEFDYVNALIANSGSNYKADGDRNVAVIILTDGIPGQDGGSSTAAAANAVISKALTAKNNGAFVYSVLIGNNDVSGFNKKGYMDGISSRYAAAESLDKLGGMSVDGVNYSISLATTTMNNFVNFGAMTTEEVKANTAVGLDNLDANSYLRQQLNDAFKFPEGFNVSTDVKVELVTGAYDEVGRFSFRETEAEINANAADAAKIYCSTDVDNKTITVTNYNYSDEYVAKNRTTPGRKLRVTISGLLADETKKIQNTSINNLDTTGIYKTKDNMDDGVEFKMLPTSYFNIPEYTYVLDYGIPMHDVDVNGILKSVSKDLSAQRDENGALAYKDKSENGLVEITNNNLDLIYKSTPTNFADSGYCLIQRDDGTYDWFEIKVVPASNVLFEESYVEDKENSTGSAWTKAGEAKTEYQEITNDKKDVYGYDEVYADDAQVHSYGSALKATVTASAKRSVTKTVDFVGKGFELISACGPNTGIMTVSVKDKAGKLIKGYVVDTYYSPDDTAINVANDNGLVCQTPIVKFDVADFGLPHGTYTVETTAVYLNSANALKKSVVGTKSNGKLAATTGVPVSTAEVSAMLAEVGLSELANADLELVWFDDNSILNGGSGAAGNTNTRATRAGGTTENKELDCYIDGFRVYYPLGEDSSNYSDSEKGATYYNVIDHLQNDGVTSSDIGLSYVELSKLPGDPETGVIPSLSFATYEQFGPQNEFYLKGNGSGALAFKVALNTPDSRVHLGLRAVQGTATVKVGAREFTINGATEMYYDVTDCVDKKDGVATITIQNTGANVVAVNNVKVTGDAAVAGLEDADLSETAVVMMEEPVMAEVVNGVVTPIVDDDTDVDNGGDDVIGGDDVTGGDDNTDNNGGSTSTPSFLEQLFAMIMQVLSRIFEFLPVGEVA